MKKASYYIVALIPARSGSKSVRHKNIRPFAGKPLMAWSIEQAHRSKLINRVIVSTDSPTYARVAREYGAEVPFLRPVRYARDRSTDLEVFQHALTWLKENEGRLPDILVHLRPTTPLRPQGMIDGVIRELIRHPNVDAVRTVAPAPLTPYKMWRMKKSGMLKPLLTVRGLKDPWNQARQVLPPVWVQTGAVDVLRADTVLRKRSMTGDRVRGYPHSHWDDIDTERDFYRAEARMKLLVALEGATASPMRFCFDLDGVLAESRADLNYDMARPCRAMIRIVNRLKRHGHYIVIHTARGSMTGIDWKRTTEHQLRRWKVEYDELRMGKPSADIYVDDRALPVADLTWLAGLLSGSGERKPE